MLNEEGIVLVSGLSGVLLMFSFPATSRTLLTGEEYSILHQIEDRGAEDNFKGESYKRHWKQFLWRDWPESQGPCNNYLEGGGVGKWVKHAPKLTHTPSLIKQNIISSPHT